MAGEPSYRNPLHKEYSNKCRRSISFNLQLSIRQKINAQFSALSSLTCLCSS